MAETNGACGGGRRMRVAVIGAGPSGLIAAHMLSDRPDLYDYDVYERGRCVGGLWVYTDKTGIDDDGYPVHSPVYKSLVVNGQKQLMEFPDFPFPRDYPQFPTHSQIHEYLESFADHFNLKPNIRFNTIVTSVKRVPTADARRPRWHVASKHTPTGATSAATYDAVFVCVGHYVVPDVPDLPGLPAFPGRVLHAHDYRVPAGFAGRRVVVVGTGSTTFDIVRDAAPLAAAVTVFAGRGDALRYDLAAQHRRGVFPRNVDVVTGWPTAARADGAVEFGASGERVAADVLVFATGYRYSYPFLDASCGVRVTDGGRRLRPLFKHMFHADHATLVFLGTMNNGSDFTLPYLQVPAALRALEGSLALPSPAAMHADEEREQQERARTGLLPRHAHAFYHAPNWTPEKYARDLVAFAGVRDVFDEMRKYEALRLLHAAQREDCLRFRDARFPYPYYTYAADDDDGGGGGGGGKEEGETATPS